MDWQRYSNPVTFRPAQTERTWRAWEGMREVKSEGLLGGVLHYGISTEGMRGLQLIPVSDLEAEITRDERNYQSRLAAQEQVSSREQQEKEAARWKGFTDDMTPRGKARADKVLSKQVSVQKKFARRGDHITRLVEEGWTVQGRTLVSPTGSFFVEKDLTKIGIDFAAYLQDS